MTMFTLNEELKGVEIYFDTKPATKILETLKSAGFRWNKFKKCWYAKQKENTLKIAKDIAENKKIEMAPTETKKKTLEIKGVKVGDIFTYSWGYDQTNVDCYQVVELKGTSTALLKEISRKFIEHTGNGMAGYFEPIKDCFVKDAETLTKRIQTTGGKEPTGKYRTYIKMAHSYAYLWDNKPFYVSWYA